MLLVVKNVPNSDERTSCSVLASSSGSPIGGIHVKFEQTTATASLASLAGRFGTVSASAGGRLCTSASLDRNRITDLFSANGAIAAAYS